MPVGRKIVEVIRGILAGAGVQSHAAVLFDDARILVRLDVSCRPCRWRLSAALSSVSIFFGSARRSLVALCFQLVVDLLRRVERLLFLGPVLRCRSQACL